MKKMKIFKGQFLNFFNAANQKKWGGSHEMYDKCYFCWDQLPKLKKEFTASFFVNFWRNRGTKEPAYITVLLKVKVSEKNNRQVEQPSSIYFSVVATKSELDGKKGREQKKKAAKAKEKSDQDGKKRAKKTREW